MNSTIDNPLAFFEYYTVESNFFNLIDKDFENAGFASYKIDLPNKVTYIEPNEYNEFIEYKTSSPSRIFLISPLFATILKNFTIHKLKKIKLIVRQIDV